MAMSSSCLSQEVGDLTLGKPSMPFLPSSSSLRDALLAFHLHPDISEISIWGDCPDLPWLSSSSLESYVCIGKISVLKILCFLASKHVLLRSPCRALLYPVSALLAHEPRSDSILQIDPHTSLLEALNAIARGVQNLVVPINGKTGGGSSRLERNHNTFPSQGREFCWLTHEDVLRFLLGSIGMFNPIHKMSVRDLGIIQTDIFIIGVDEQISSCLHMIKETSMDMAAVAVVDCSSGPPRLVGEISTSLLHGCNESAAVAMATLSAAEFMEFAQNWRNPPENIVEAMRLGLCKKMGGSWRGGNGKKEPLQEWFGNFTSIMQGEWSEMWEESSLSSDDNDDNDNGHPAGSHEKASSGGQSGAKMRRSYPIRCRPNSSLIAVIMQALAHREHYVWVTKEDDVLVGLVTFAGILGVLSNHLRLSPP